MVRQVIRNKVLVIPYTTLADGSFEFLMVQDRKTTEWGFISGGMKRNEQPEQAAIREVYEETSGVLNTDDLVYVTSFVSMYRPVELKEVDRRNGERVKSVIHLFMLGFDKTTLKPFYPNKEVTDLRVAKYDDFTNVWSFCDDVYFERVSSLFN